MSSSMEKFLLGLVQGVTMPGDSTMSFRLPGRRYTLEGLLSALEQGKPVDVKNLSDYLRELERWQVAILAAHHESVRVWFEKPDDVAHAAGTAAPPKIGLTTGEIQVKF